MEAMAAVNNTRRSKRVPRLEILFLSPLNFPDWLTEGSMPKNATKAFADLNRLKSPISATSVTAAMKPIPGIASKTQYACGLELGTHLLEYHLPKLRLNRF